MVASRLGPDYHAGTYPFIVKFCGLILLFVLNGSVEGQLNNDVGTPTPVRLLREPFYIHPGVGLAIAVQGLNRYLVPGLIVDDQGINRQGPPPAIHYDHFVAAVDSHKDEFRYPDIRICLLGPVKPHIGVVYLDFESLWDVTVGAPRSLNDDSVPGQEVLGFQGKAVGIVEKGVLSEGQVSHFSGLE